MALRILLLLFISIAFVQAHEAEHKDREISIRKDIDIFGKQVDKEVTTVNKLKNMFSEGKVSGQLRSMYVGYDQKENTAEDTYATALGGTFKYELAEFNGFNAGIAFVTSHDIAFATGDAAKQNSELSSVRGNYTELSEAYINYKNAGFNLRLGRQLIDTPLADADDSLMVPNTFEAYILIYDLDKITLTLGNIQEWQGASTGLGYFEDGLKRKSSWVKTGNRGTYLAGIEYDNLFEVNAWYYDISQKENATKASYIDIGKHTGESDIRFHSSVQYLHQSKNDTSDIQADILGALIEFVAYSAGFNISYNKSKKYNAKRSFTGMGGGTLYTNMDTMKLDTITEDREAESFVLGLVYHSNNWNFLYAYGDFEGKENSLGEKVHMTEQNIAFEYTFNEELIVAGIYVIQNDKLNLVNTANDFEKLQVMVKYNF
ncbi:MAG: hypothetical protein Q9M32_01120 [Sulfurimonas sp.]|nr:hypothetical protein [Sulfurimonas sp.]MDQ7059755.1 hypothetical protein [Sulfurimonas sp.]